MIYIINNENNTISTDSWLDYIVTSVSIYLDDKYIGTYNNESTKIQYIKVTIPSTDLVNIQNMDYKLKFINGNDGSIFKIESVCVKSNITTNRFYFKNTTTNKFFYGE